MTPSPSVIKASLQRYNGRLQFLYTAIQESHLNDRGEELLSGPLYKLQDGKLLLNDESKGWIERTSLPAEYDQGAVYTGTKMLYTAVKWNCEYQRLKGCDLNPYTGWISTGPKGLLFKKGREEVIDISKISLQERRDIFGDSTSDSLLHYEEELRKTQNLGMSKI